MLFAIFATIWIVYIYNISMLNTKNVIFLCAGIYLCMAIYLNQRKSEISKLKTLYRNTYDEDVQSTNGTLRSEDFGVSEMEPDSGVVNGVDQLVDEVALAI